jgi:surface antigen
MNLPRTRLVIGRRRVRVLAAALAATGALAAPAGAPISHLVTAGYPYAAECPAAGRRDAVDRWKMDTCNCTSYVAWALQRNGFRVDWFVPGSMDARNWPSIARLKGIAVGKRPRPGAVAVWPEVTKFGHVALVTGSRGGTMDVAEYNLPPRLGGVRFGFDRRSHVRTAGATFVYVPRRRG